ncbi:MAG: DUF1428 domain-containing protein [Polyangiaceae bacterium]|nr:DUF1428 domain-containing protein [Polyangiaceae bacterium]
MTYVDGFLLAVPVANKDTYQKRAAQAAPVFRELGARRFVEAWGDDIPEGAVTDFRLAVKANTDEAVVFTWIEYASKEARDAAKLRILAEPRLKELGVSFPFDMQRMIYGGFAPLVEDGTPEGLGYVGGYLVAAPNSKKDAYRELAANRAKIFRDHGATRLVEAWADDVPDGRVTDYRSAVRAKADESVVFAWVEWASKEARQAGMKKAFQDPRMVRPDDAQLFDGRRMIIGGFTPLIDV